MSWELCQNSRIRQITHFMIGNIRNQFPCAILHNIGVVIKDVNIVHRGVDRNERLFVCLTIESL